MAQASNIADPLQKKGLTELPKCFLNICFLNSSLKVPYRTWPAQDPAPTSSWDVPMVLAPLWGDAGQWVRHKEVTASDLVSRQQSKWGK